MNISPKFRTHLATTQNILRKAFGHKISYQPKLQELFLVTARPLGHLELRQNSSSKDSQVIS